MAPKDNNCLIPQIRECYITWQRGIQIADRIKVVNQLTLKWRELILDYLKGRWKKKAKESHVMRGRLYQPLLELKTEGIHKHRMWAASINWQKQENEFSPRLLERNAALPMP